MEDSMVKKLSKSAKEIISKIEELIKEGNLRRIIIKDENGEVFIEIPMLVGAIVTLAAPFVSAIGVIAGFAANFSVEIIKKDNSKIILLCENNKSDK
jgi:Domain of unknown function (DUF4342)